MIELPLSVKLSSFVMRGSSVGTLGNLSIAMAGATVITLGIVGKAQATSFDFCIPLVALVENLVSFSLR
jgi:hypothetical protein